MKPLDPRLLRYARSARRYILEIALLGTLMAALVIGQAFLISGAASPVITRSATLAEIMPTVGWLALVILARGLLLYLRESRAHRAADQTVAELREQVVNHAVALGPRWRATHGSNTVTLVTRGLDDLGPYFVRFLPQLLLVMTVTPATLVAILLLDFWSALVALVTIPLIPIFMILIGRLTQSASATKLAAMERLGSQLLDLLTGLPTLRALGRERGPRTALVDLSGRNTKATMQTLRIAFLSGGVLEFLATLSVALVAVQVGFRMVAGNIPLATGLVIIMLAPEVFEPLRQVGAQFHASANGVAAANSCFEILEQTPPPSGDEPAPDLTRTRLVFDGVSVAARGAWAPAELTEVVEPGQITALAGPSGAGKSTAVAALLGLEPPTRGQVLIGSVPLSRINLPSLWRQLSWVPQSPTLVPGTIRENVSPTASVEELDEAARLTGFDQVLASLALGWETPLGLGGLGLSVGQRQRLALTRALLVRPPLLVLDEPTAHLDALSEDQIVQILAALRSRGTTVLVIAHRAAVLGVADRVIQVQSAPATEGEMDRYPQLASSWTGQVIPVEMPGFLDPRALTEAEAHR